MDLESLLAKSEISISPKAKNFCREGFSRMEKSKDPFHDARHIRRLLENLDGLLFSEKDLRKKVDFETLLISLVWHDVWKAGRFPLGFLSAFWGELAEGWSGYFLVRGEMEKFGFGKRKIKDVAYALRKHSYFQFLPIRTREAKILRDVDKLDQWNLERIKPLERILFAPGGVVGPRFLRLAKFYFEKVMLKTEQGHFYFSWSKKEFWKRRAAVLSEAARLEKEYEQYLG